MWWHIWAILLRIYYATLNTIAKYISVLTNLVFNLARVLKTEIKLFVDIENLLILFLLNLLKTAEAAGFHLNNKMQMYNPK